MASEMTWSPKRSLEVDGAGQSWTPTKRRRCMQAVRPSLGTSPTKDSVSPFASAVPKITSDEIIARLSAETSQSEQQHRRWGPLRNIALPLPSSSHSSSSMLSPQALSPSPLPPLTDSATITTQSSVTAMQTTVIGSSDGGCSTLLSSPPLLQPHHRDVPMLTLKQVGLVCERMLREREEQLRQEYDRALACRLSEQYEAFLMFNHDQLHRRIGEEAASYVS